VSNKWKLKNFQIDKHLNSTTNMLFVELKAKAHLYIVKSEPRLDVGSVAA
jgi:hypothetical protein